jgi:hypothetical protein
VLVAFISLKKYVILTVYNEVMCSVIVLPHLIQVINGIFQLYI